MTAYCFFFLFQQLGRVERECEITKQSLKEEKLKQSASGKSAAKNQESFLSKTEKTYAAKLDRLVRQVIVSTHLQDQHRVCYM